MPVADLRRALLDRILASRQFERATKLRAFLTFICKHVFDGETGDMNEQRIGVHVFGRPPGYNPAEDNTVRVQARILRQKLAEYFEEHGAEEPLWITIPKGRYIPLFAAPAMEEAPATHPWRMAAFALAAVVVALAGVVLHQWLELRHLGPARESARIGESALTSLVVRPNQKTVIVAADTALVVAQEIAGAPVSLEQYTGPDYRAKMKASIPGIGDGPFWDYLLTRRYTSIGDVQLYGRLLQLYPAEWGNLEPRHARTLRTQDFRQGNFVLIGSMRSDTWVTMFSDHLNFRLPGDRKDHPLTVVSRAPRPGEPAEFNCDPLPNGAGRAYAQIAYLPNLSHTGRVLIVAGTTGSATEAAVDFVCAAGGRQRLERMWNAGDVSALRSFEILLEVQLLGDAAKSTQIVGTRFQ